MNSTFTDISVAFKRKSNWQLTKAYWLFKLIQYPIISFMGKKLIGIALWLRLPIKPLLKPTLFQQFVGGENISETMTVVDDLFDNYQVGSILDYAAEGNENENSFKRAFDQIHQTIMLAQHKEAIPFAVFKLTAISSANELKEDRQVGAPSKERIEQLFSSSATMNIRLLIDAEESWLQTRIDQHALEGMQKYNQNQTLIFNTLQCYRKDALNRLQKWHQLAIKMNFKLGIKLVRGAYLEKENEEAVRKGIESPICSTKSATDVMFDQCMTYCLNHLDEIEIMIATHNEHSLSKMQEIMKELNLPPNDPRIFSAQLYGMSDHLTFNLIKARHNTVKYIPFGPLRKVLPYLFRRADENTSVLGQSSRELTLIKEEIRRRKSKG